MFLSSHAGVSLGFDLVVADAGAAAKLTPGLPAFAIPRPNALAYSASAALWV